MHSTSRNPHSPTHEEPSTLDTRERHLEPVPGRDVLKGLWAQGSLCNLAEVVEALPHPEQGGDSVTEGEGTDNPTCAGLLLGILFVHQLRYGGAPVVRERVPGVFAASADLGEADQQASHTIRIQSLHPDGNPLFLYLVYA